MEKDAAVVVAAVAATAVAGVDLGVLAMTASVVTVAIIAGVASYAAAIRQARDEIKVAFDEHLARMHADHEKIVVAMTDTSED